MCAFAPTDSTRFTTASISACVAPSFITIIMCPYSLSNLVTDTGDLRRGASGRRTPS
jgi:hypothetical protein